MIHLVTGYAGYEHIKSSDDGDFNASFFGDGQFIMEAGNQFDASIIDNNTVRVLDGNGMMYGRHFRLERNTYEDVVIANGSAGMNRCDLICVTYVKDESTGIEQTYLEVIKGTETTGTAAIPAYVNGNILNGAVFNQMPLYKVTISGVVLKQITPMFEVAQSCKKLAEKHNIDMASKGEAWVLIWENKAPKNQFAAQNFAFDTKKYSHYIVMTDDGGSNNITFVHQSSNGETWAYMMGFDSGNGYKIIGRRVWTTANYIHFDDCKRRETYGTGDGTVDNTKLIPVKIYGVNL